MNRPYLCRSKILLRIREKLVYVVQKCMMTSLLLWQRRITVTVCIFKNDVHLWKPVHCCSPLPLQMQLRKTQTQLRKTQTQLRKILKWSCSAFRKLVCIWTQHSSEEALWFLKEAYRFAAEAVRFSVQAAPQTHFGKTFRMLASFFWRVP